MKCLGDGQYGRRRGGLRGEGRQEVPETVKSACRRTCSGRFTVLSGRRPSRPNTVKTRFSTSIAQATRRRRRLRQIGPKTAQNGAVAAYHARLLGGQYGVYESVFT